jgi:4-amino-4-deoxy-L-arabinose transferase-like glycosyltransferase
VIPAVSERAAILGLLLVLGFRIAIAATIVPPWQGPDEPQHTYLIALLTGAYGPGGGAEAAVVESMYRNDWWEHYQRQRPREAPHTFADGPARVTDVKGAPGGPVLFHSTAAGVFRFAGVGGVEVQYRWLRAAAAAMGAASFLIVWAANRAVFGADTALASATILAFHPQFMLVSLNANPDAPVVLLGAIVWLAAAFVVTRRSNVVASAAAWLCAGLGVLIRRLAFPLLIDAAIVSGLAFWKMRERRRWLTGALSVVAAGALLAWTQDAEHVRAAVAWSAGSFTPGAAIAGVFGDPGFAWLLALTLFKSFWLTAGWMRYEAPLWWYLLVALICASACAGCIRVLLLKDTQRRVARAALVVAAAFVVVQVLAIFTAYVPVRAGVQGRYLMPVIGPVTGLLAAGLVDGWHWASRTRMMLTLVVLFAAVDLLSWALVLIPVYASA